MMLDRPKRPGTWGVNITIALDQFHYLFEDVHRLISLSVKSTLVKQHNATRPLSRCYTITFGQKYCKSSQRA